ncbi:pantoate--beta-alanine ligase [Schumannella luteola]|uniref:Pantothenate synthetase n=1 Tax=Schumannella luteola TaxID=472059 RepID=A0A852Y899_9MICO|nr:pantoate--beta-alanine ligase [Schumannella luteola]
MSAASDRPEVIESIAALRERFPAGTVALVPTMGALHAGHVALVDHAAALARETGGEVVVSIFVNPLQFGPNEDLARYPRDLDADLDTLAGHGVAAVFHPSVEEMYPQGPSQTRVTAGEVGGLWEGASRPGHFDGMLTVVAKLLGIVRPAAAVFGQKDAQQLFLVQRMVRDLDIPSRIVGVDTVRADDGLALSSRNRYLGDDERIAARVLSAALAAARATAAGATAAGDGAAPASAVRAAAEAVITDEPLAALDYLGIVDPATFHPVDDEFRGEARVIIAAKVGPARLIDNGTLDLRPGATD